MRVAVILCCDIVGALGVGVSSSEVSNSPIVGIFGAWSCDIVGALGVGVSSTEVSNSPIVGIFGAWSCDIVGA